MGSGGGSGGPSPQQVKLMNMQITELNKLKADEAHRKQAFGRRRGRSSLISGSERGIKDAPGGGAASSGGQTTSYGGQVSGSPKSLVA